VKWLFVFCGALVALIALKDLFHTLFHPASSGHVSDWISLRLWRIFRKAFRARLEAAGPVIFLAIISYWTASVVLGFAMIYRPFMPDRFALMSGLATSSLDSYFAAVNLSLGNLISIYIGAVPKDNWIQFITGIEAICGFAILTASISWILSIYPVLEHRRSLAHQVTLLHLGEATGARPLESLADSELQTILLSLASQLTQHRNELTQFPITYFFVEDEKKTGLGGLILYMSELADRFIEREGAVRYAAVALDGAIKDFLQVIGRISSKRSGAQKKKRRLHWLAITFVSRYTRRRTQH
jgi:hypothetical protein